ncbi:hypothetical protein ZWY2020_040543 [Hordeum vulgare]|nr:hypothetical protein ZWY2020_040543 [Hordeum vulgare]
MPEKIAVTIVAATAVAVDRRSQTRSIDNKLLQWLPDSSVIPASDRHGRHRPADCPSRLGRARGVASPVSKDSRGRSPPPLPRTTSYDVIQLTTLPEETSSTRWIAPCFGTKQPPVGVCPVSALQASTTPHFSSMDVIEIVLPSPAMQAYGSAVTPPRAPSPCTVAESVMLIFAQWVASILAPLCPLPATSPSPCCTNIGLPKAQATNKEEEDVGLGGGSPGADLLA